jgi:phosphoserine phosphatase
VPPTSLVLVSSQHRAKALKEAHARHFMVREGRLPEVVVFDCDGVLVDAVSSWRTLHDAYGTDNGQNLNRFIRGEISDVEFMRSDIQMWKAVVDPIHRDDLFRAYAGVTLMPGAREVVARLQEEGVFVAIVSAGVDLFVSSIASMLKVDDWIANGFVFDEAGFLTDEGVCRLHATGKGEVIEKLLAMNDLSAERCVSVGDSEMDLSMHVEGSRFIGFNPSRASSVEAFENAGVPVVVEKDLRAILPLLGLEED